MIYRDTVAVGPFFRFGCPFPICHLSRAPPYTNASIYEYIGFDILAESGLITPMGT